MAIPFVCERCGHPIEVDDRLAGKHGTCKHCGQPLVVPDHAAGGGAAPLRLRPLEGEEAVGVADHLLARPVPLNVRPAEEEPKPTPEAISSPDEPPLPGRRGSGLRGRRPDDDYGVLDPFHFGESRGRAGPPPLWMNLPTLTARRLASLFRTLRDWFYLVSLFFLVIVLLGYLFQVKALLHLGAAGVIASNIGILVSGVSYLVTLPFKESLHHGLANVLIPFYAIYYWTTRWHRMRTPVYKTLGSFTPILLVAIAYFVYEEAPVVKARVEQRLPAIEGAIERKVPASLQEKVDRALEPSEGDVAPDQPRGRRSR
jgi:hypothetical protein